MKSGQVEVDGLVITDRPGGGARRRTDPAGERAGPGADRAGEPVDAVACQSQAPPRGRPGHRRSTTQVGLNDSGDHLVEELSGGEQQRVAVARGMAQQARRSSPTSRPASSTAQPRAGARSPAYTGRSRCRRHHRHPRPDRRRGRRRSRPDGRRPPDVGTIALDRTNLVLTRPVGVAAWAHLGQQRVDQAGEPRGENSASAASRSSTVHHRHSETISTSHSGRGSGMKCSVRTM